MASSNMYIQTTPNLNTENKLGVNQLTQNNFKFIDNINNNGDRNLNVKNVNSIVDVTNPNDNLKVNKSNQQHPV
jgi:hypothetical protein